MTISVSRFAAKAAGVLIVGSLMVGSGFVGYQAIGKGFPTPTAVTQPPGNAQAEVRKKRAVTQLELAKNAFRVIAQMQTQGSPVSTEACQRWSVRLLEAERVTSKTKAEEVAAFEQHLTRMGQLKDRSHKLYETGQLTFLQHLDTEYWYNEAAAWVDKAREEAVAPPRD